MYVLFAKQSSDFLHIPFNILLIKGMCVVQPNPWAETLIRPSSFRWVELLT